MTVRRSTPPRGKEPPASPNWQTAGLQGRVCQVKRGCTVLIFVNLKCCLLRALLPPPPSSPREGHARCPDYRAQLFSARKCPALLQIKRRDYRTTCGSWSREVRRDAVTARLHHWVGAPRRGERASNRPPPRQTYM